jgi:hypothetical protein
VHEKEILEQLFRHRIDSDNLNNGTGDFDTVSLKELANKIKGGTNDSDFSYGRLKVVYNKHKQWLLQQNKESNSGYGMGSLPSLLELAKNYWAYLDSKVLCKK